MPVKKEQVPKEDAASVVAQHAAAIDDADDERPAVLSPKYRTSHVETKGQPAPVTPLPVIVDEETITVFRHRESGKFYQFNQAFQSDPNFVPEVVKVGSVAFAG